MKVSQERDVRGQFAKTSSLVCATGGALRRAPLVAFTGPG